MQWHEDAIACEAFAHQQCSSCTLLDVPYTKQLADKQSHMQSTLTHHIDDAEVCAPFSSGVRHFRNKAKMQALGYAHAPILGIVHENKEVSLTHCMLYTPAMQALLGYLERFIQIAGLPTYRIDKQKGELKFIHVLQNSRDEFMVRFVLRSTKVLAQLKSYLPLLHKAHPNVRVVTANILPQHKAVLQGEQEFYLTQERALIEHINGVPLYMSAQGFFQTNIDVTTSLYATAQAWTHELKVPYIWDLFCGVGGFGLSIAKTSSRLVGIEINQEAIAYAKKSAQALNLRDVNFMALPSEDFALFIDEVPDLVVVNPPRKGVGTALSKRIQAMNVAYILYSSCNVHTLKEDLEALDNYSISKIKLFDMFAHTLHYEVLVLLKQKTQTIDTPEREFER